MVVHDLRSPLSAIMNFLYAIQLRSSDKLDAVDNQNISDALASGKTLIEMVSSMLDVNRFETDQMPLKWELCDLRELARNAVDGLNKSSRREAIVCKTPAEPLMISGDKAILHRIVVNLISNALKFTQSDGKVSVRVEVDESGLARLSVQDTGRGIPADSHERIFDKFGQVGEQAEGVKYSTGLGLTFCKLAVEAHSGTIGLVSEVGQGSTFWFTLPYPVQEGKMASRTGVNLPL